MNSFGRSPFTAATVSSLISGFNLDLTQRSHTSVSVVESSEVFHWD
ncbi:hypothetical protein H6G00_00905 [Leptolyngbya sp. FACHB-541]|nr:hypothetical protein [Leptolyngbya sp. FACHB-541]MBD1995187.1 hypothetical protein [Leptolyngbya sp. FACHB-541]